MINIFCNPDVTSFTTIIGIIKSRMRGEDALLHVLKISRCFVTIHLFFSIETLIPRIFYLKIHNNTSFNYRPFIN